MKHAYLGNSANIEGILIAIIFLASCQVGCSQNMYKKERYRELLNSTVDKFKILPTSETWKIVFAHDDQKLRVVEANILQKDTAYYIRSVHYLEKDSIVLESFRKSYTSEGHAYICAMNDRGRPVYLYKYDENDPGQTKVFIFGKYNFLFESSAFSRRQEEFYLAHKDSLDSVKGNQVVPLPID